jgi:PKD repeat protein
VTFDFGDGSTASTGLAGATATVSHAYAAAGSYTASATYHGDAANLTSVGTTAQDVGKSATATLGSLPNPSGVGQPIAFTATVTARAGIPTGTVKFDFGDGSSALGTLTSGISTVNHSYASAGSFTAVATYHGDGYILSVGTTTQTVALAAAGTTVGSIQQPSGADRQSLSSPRLQQRLSPGPVE